MADHEQFESFREFPPEVLTEIVREGEARMEALLQIASAADLRAMTLAGLQIGAATASLGAGLVMLYDDQGEIWLSGLAVIFAAAMILASLLAVSTLRPAKFHVPGNSPVNWLPQYWLGGEAHGFSLVQARIEQAACLELAINENQKWIEWAGARVRRSIDCMLAAVGIAGLVLLVWIVLVA